jgi:superfamily II DNA or RNA helicase
MKPLYPHPVSWKDSPPDLDAVQSWQMECLDGAAEQGYRSVLVQASMGTGKTILAAKRALKIQKSGRRMVFLCSLKTLVEQAQEKFSAWGVDVQVEQGSNKARSIFGRPPHVIASKDSLHPNRINDFIRRTRLDTCEVEVVLDEAHLSVSDSWATPIRLLNPVFTIGLSGTPFRMDGKRLFGSAAPFESLSSRYDFLTACRHRNLVSPILVECGVSVDLRDIKITRQVGGRDYDPKALTLRINESLGTLCRAAKEHVQEFGVTRFLMFLPDVGTCRAAETFWSGFSKADGSPYKVRSIYGELPPAEVKRIKGDYHAGKLDGLMSCQMLDIGFDDPPTDGIILATPTQSPVKVLQQGGRGSRLYPGKSRYVVIGYRWQSQGEPPQSTLDLLLRGIPDERTRALAGDLLRSRRGMKFLEAVEQAEIYRRQEIAEERRRLRELPVSCVDAPVDHSVRVLDLVSCASDLDKLTQRQLRQCGLVRSEIARLSSREADSFLEKWFHLRDASLASYKQVQALLRMGISESSALGLTKRQAQAIIYKGLPSQPQRWSHA